MFHIFVQVQEVEEIVFQLINLGEIKISSKKVLKHWHQLQNNFLPNFSSSKSRQSRASFFVLLEQLTN